MGAQPITTTDELLAELIDEVRGLRSDLAGRSRPAPRKAPVKKRAATVDLDGR